MKSTWFGYIIMTQWGLVIYLMVHGMYINLPPQVGEHMSVPCLHLPTIVTNAMLSNLSTCLL
jgi:hypothetical protein